MAGTPSFTISTQMGRSDGVGGLGPNEVKVWEIYQDFLSCIDMTVIEPSAAAIVAALLASSAIQQITLAAIDEPNKGKP